MSDTSQTDGLHDGEQEAAEAQQIVTNDAVAGETVLPGAGDGNDGPTGGAPGEGTPVLADNDLGGEDIPGLRDEAPSGPVETHTVDES